MAARKPRIGILGIMQDLYDDMIPGIAHRQEGYAAEVAAHLADVGEFIPSKPIKYREDAERELRAFENADLDGVMVVMLTYGPAMRVARLLAESRLPILLANIQPEPSVTPAWDMADMTYNQGVHGAQDTANAMVRAGGGSACSPTTGRASPSWRMSAAGPGPPPRSPRGSRSRWRCSATP